ncbi:MULTISPECIES: peptidoglycan-binding protein [unclassified Anabaena]|uniref:peptidoglycan-binding protein n=1 Tax=unclassified Anabaena TaxID=2619674 RepID=UPI0039C61A93
MRLCHSSILIFICLTCLGYPIRASTIEPNLTPTELAQAGSTIPVTQSVLIPGSQGADVQELQTQLKDLGYYNGVVDGSYQANTQNAVVQFQKAKDLRRIDGTADMATRRSLRTAWAAKNQLVAADTANSLATNQPQSNQQSFLWWSLLGLGILGSIGAIVFLLKWLQENQQEQESANKEFKALSPSEDDSVNSPSSTGEAISDSQENTAVVTNSQTTQTSNTASFVSLESTSRLAKVNIVDELIQDLRNHDSQKRRKAIWDLGQQGDSRAIQPLVDLMMDADSQQRSLILAALAEINSRALKPMNRALAISLQDESPQVRQNAIRDLTRIYDMMTQMSQMLVHATEDPDVDVQITAKYALSQMNRIRNLPNQRSLPEDNNKDQEAEDL